MNFFAKNMGNMERIIRICLGVIILLATAIRFQSDGRPAGGGPVIK